MLTAAIYARKSTDQVADADAKSVAMQVAAAQAFAKAKGWTVSGVYVDDKISGAETKRLRDRNRLLARLGTPEQPKVILMRDASRFSRSDGDEAFGELKRIAQTGVEVWFYQEDKPFRHGTFGDNVVGFVRAEMNAEYRRQISRWVTDAMVRKAQAGHVCGGRVFGYDNLRVNGHVERRINPAQAAIVRRIFDLSAKGWGYQRIAHALNADQVPAPRPTAAKSAGWNGAGVSHVLHRPIYRGHVVWNRSKRRDATGQVHVHARPEADWLTQDRPELRIVTDALWHTVHRRLTSQRTEYDRLNPRRPYARDQNSAYLLTGFARCVCGAGLHRRKQDRAGGAFVNTYACTGRYNKGPQACPHADQWPMADLDRAVLTSILGEALGPALVDRVFATAKRRFEQTAQPNHAAQLERALAAVERELARMTTAIASGAGEVPALVARLRTTEAKRRALVVEVEQARQTRPAPRWRDVEAGMRQRLADWRSTLAGKVATVRDGFRQLLTTPIRCTPCVVNGFRAIRFEGRIGLAAIFGGELVTNLQTPKGS
jgi:site-specific DNA recombinase